MPTVILLDSSLSMSRLATPNPNPDSPIELSSTGRSIHPCSRKNWIFWLKINMIKDGKGF